MSSSQHMRNILLLTVTFHICYLILIFFQQERRGKEGGGERKVRERIVGLPCKQKEQNCVSMEP